MTNRNSLLGRSRPADRLSKADREALEGAVAEPAPTQAPTKTAQAKTAPAGNTTRPANIGKDGQVRQDQLKFHWTTECPACGFKVAGSGYPQPGQRLARCGRCKITLFLNRS